MSELRTECYHLLRSKEAGLRDLGHVLPCDTTFSFKELTQLLWVSKQGFSIFIFTLEIESHYVALTGLELGMEIRLILNSQRSTYSASQMLGFKVHSQKSIN